MKILALDIGSGTEDILLYDSNKNLENCIKLVLPSPTGILAEKLKALAEKGRRFLITGDTVGGGALTGVVKDFLKQGYRFYATEAAAYTFYNDLDRVRRLGVEVLSKAPETWNGPRLETQEVNIKALALFLQSFGEKLENLDAVALAVQDHGVPPRGEAGNKFRLKKMREPLLKDPSLASLMFSEDRIPDCYYRMKSGVKAAKRQLPNIGVWVMDSVPAAVLGCLQDEAVKFADCVLAMNLGNSHTIMAVVDKGTVLGLMEHHTSLLTPSKLETFAVNLAEGRLTSEEVLADGGHGAFYISSPRGFKNLELVAATGPRRGMLKDSGLKVHFAYPGGDVMMAGTLGLVEAVRKKLGEEKAGLA
ncbi:DUF1786 domain-containing protein [Candidatus Hecatella orcuttiae]|uniref:DUF1786 domain-containing protein n=1 Tax=Candidatus Hecatella orcuttiae TaxID=1935119 RepID=UPI002867E635|nr:DUF1786 family protein [Candidatus Hecatella orcuttiae]